MRFSESFNALYDVKKLLGEGGMGRVILAEDRRLQRPVAIKLLADFDDGPEGLMRQRFVEEARVCAGFKHPNIVRMFSSGFEDGKPYMVFEFVDGEDLGKRLEQQGPQPVDEVLAIAEATLAGLQYAHEHKVIHRDVKPANIILRRDGGEAMLMDFGVAKSNSGRTFKTQTNLILGTPLYMAPELIKRETMGPGVDVYALGCSLYECLTGVPPYMGKSDVVVLEMHLHATPEPLRKLRPEIAEDVELLIERAMMKDAEKRFKSAKEMSGWIETIRSGGRVPRAKTLPQMPAPPGATTRPDVVAPLSRTPRASAATRPVSAPSRPGRGPVPSTGTRMMSEPVETPSAITARRSKRGWIAGALVAAAAAGLYAWHLAGGRPSDVRLAFGAAGLEVTWRTANATRGAVFHKAMEGAFSPNQDGTLDRPPDHAQLTRTDEDAPTTHHRVLVPALRPGDHLVVSLPGPSGASGWARAVLVPPAPWGRQLPPDPGATVSRVVAQTGLMRAVLLEARPHTGDMVPAKPVLPDVAELTFEANVAPELLSERSCVRGEQFPGVSFEMPVRTMTGHAARLLQALERVSAPRVIAELVKDPLFDRNGDFDNMLGETPLLDGMPKQVARKLSPDGHFLERVKRALDPSGTLAALEDFRPFAGSWFAAAGVPDDQKLEMYNRLLSLEHLDALIRGQLDAPRQLGIASLYEPLVKSTFTVCKPETPFSEPPPGAVVIMPGGYAWIGENYGTWKTLASWCREYAFYRGMVGGPVPTAEEARTRFPSKRVFPVSPVPGAGGPGVAEVRASFALLGPNYYYDLVFPGRPQPFRVRIAQPATPEFRKVMDDAGSAAKVPPHAEVVISFPARFLPPDESMQVSIEYRHLPGPRTDALMNVERGSMTRDISILVR